MSATEAGDPVGSLADEFTKLLGALAGCLGEHGEHSDEADVEDAEAVDGRSAECRFCPICRTVHAVRDVSPEVKEHLRNAGFSLLQAASGLLAALTADTQAGEKPRPRPATDIEHIDLDDDSGPHGEEK